MGNRMKFLKISGYVLIGMILIFVVAGAVFIGMFDESAIKSMVTKKVKQQTGRELVIGEIKPSLFPWLGATLHDVSLSNATGFSVEKMLEIKQLDAHIALMPLLKREINLDVLRLYGLVLFLEKNSKGITNWDDIVNRLKKPQTDNKIQTTAGITQPVVATENKINNNKSDNNNNGMTGTIEGLDITDATIHWHDEASGQTLEIEKTKLTTGAIRPDTPLQINLTSEVALPELDVRLLMGLKSRLIYDRQTQVLILNDLNVSLDALMQKSTVQQLQLELQTRATADIKQQTVHLSEFLLNMKLQAETLSKKEIEARLSGTLLVDGLKQTIVLKPLKIVSANVTLNSEIDVSQFLNDFKIDGQLQLDDFSLRQFAKELAVELPEMPNDKALSRVAFNGSFNGNKNEFVLKKSLLNIDESKLGLEIGIHDFEKPKIIMVLDIDKLNINNYMMSSVETPNASSVNREVASKVPVKNLSTQKPGNQLNESPIELPIKMLRQLNIQGQLKVDELIYQEYNINQIELKTTAKQGVIDIDLLNANLLEGSINASAQLNVANKMPRYDMKLNGKSLEIKTLITPALKKILGDKQIEMSGPSMINVKLKTQGESVTELIAASNGGFALNIEDAKLHGIDVEYFVRQDLVDYLKRKQKKVPDELPGTYTPKTVTALKIASMTANIKQGVIYNNDLLLLSKKMKVTGFGNVDLPRKKIDYRLNLSIVSDKNKKLSDKLLVLPLPVDVKGDFLKPDIKVDWKDRMKSVSKVLKKDVKDKLKIKVNKKLDKKVDKFKDRLKKYFK